MSEIMLGVLNMPDELFWAGDAITRFQHNQIRREAASEIAYLRDLCERASAHFSTAMSGPADADLVQELADHSVGFHTRAQARQGQEDVWE